MFKKICLVFLTAMFVSSEGFGIRDLVDLLLGGNYGNRPGYYPGGGYDGEYYPGNHGPPGPPGAHPGCPLCDSSVYSYCYRKQVHDSCCCGQGFNLFLCGKTDCSSLYANSCEEFELITNCCCVDLQKKSGQISPTDLI